MGMRTKDKFYTFTQILPRHIEYDLLMVDFIYHIKIIHSFNNTTQIPGHSTTTLSKETTKLSENKSSLLLCIKVFYFVIMM